jgi:hypothetical protein
MNLKEFLESGAHPKIRYSEKENCIAEIVREEQKYNIARHALIEFLDESPDITTSSNPTSNEIIIGLKRMYYLFENSEKIKRKRNALAIIKNGFKIAEYYYNNGWVFVVEEGNLLKTTYRQQLSQGTFVRIEPRRNAL